MSEPDKQLLWTYNQAAVKLVLTQIIKQITTFVGHDN